MTYRKIMSVIQKWWLTYCVLFPFFLPRDFSDCLCPNIVLARAVQGGSKGVNLKVPSNLHQCCLQRSPHFVQFGDKVLRAGAKVANNFSKESQLKIKETSGIESIPKSISGTAEFDSLAKGMPINCNW